MSSARRISKVAASNVFRIRASSHSFRVSFCALVCFRAVTDYLTLVRGGASSRTEHEHPELPARRSNDCVRLASVSGQCPFVGGTVLAVHTSERRARLRRGGRRRRPFSASISSVLGAQRPPRSIGVPA